MSKNGFKVMDSDMHVYEPWDLWLNYIDPEYKERAPVGTTKDPLTMNMAMGGKLIANFLADSSSWVLVITRSSNPWFERDSSSDNRCNSSWAMSDLSWRIESSRRLPRPSTTDVKRSTNF